jgi:hypothetical protein
LIPNSNEDVMQPSTMPLKRRDWRWLVFASFLVTTACLDQRCGLTSPTGSHEEQTINLPVELYVGRGFTATEVRVVVNGVSTSFTPNLDDRQRDIVLPNLTAGEPQSISVLIYVKDLVTERFVHSGSCAWDGKVGLRDPEIFIDQVSSSPGYSVECYEWQE